MRPAGGMVLVWIRRTMRGDVRVARTPDRGAPLRGPADPAWSPRRPVYPRRVRVYVPMGLRILNQSLQSPPEACNIESCLVEDFACDAGVVIDARQIHVSILNASDHH